MSVATRRQLVLCRKSEVHKMKMKIIFLKIVYNSFERTENGRLLPPLKIEQEMQEKLWCLRGHRAKPCARSNGSDELPSNLSLGEARERASEVAAQLPRITKPFPDVGASPRCLLESFASRAALQKLHRRVPPL